VIAKTVTETVAMSADDDVSAARTNNDRSVSLRGACEKQAHGCHQ
jgi:hypothetical protein